MRNKNFISSALKGASLLTGLLLVLSYWLIDAALDTYLLGGGSFHDNFHTHSLMENTMRVQGSLLILLCWYLYAVLRKTALAEEKLRNEAAQYHSFRDSVLDGFSVFDGFIVSDTESRIIECNSKAEEIFGYDKGEFTGMSITDLMPAEYVEDHEMGMRRYCKTGKGNSLGKVIELNACRKNGEIFSIELILNDLILNGQTFFIGTVHDISERKQAEESMAHMTYYDAMTGLPNRILFRDRLDQVLLRGKYHRRHGAVLFIDLDRFNMLNDSIGHLSGDEVLKIISRRLEDTLREGDTVARLGNDEFGILLQDLAKVDDLPVLIEKIFKAINKAINIAGKTINMSASVGASTFPEDGEDADTILKNADNAMYRAKTSAENSFQMYTRSMTVDAEKLLNMEGLIVKGLAEEQFTLHYQPEFDVRTGEIAAMEALVRLYSTKHELISPGDFIPVAEFTGLIIPLSEWVLRTACTQNKDLQDSGFTPVPVSVNISPRVFSAGNFLSLVETVLEETELDASYLELELTEETLMKNVAGTIDTMKALKKLGVRLSIDDFGTGFSSLSYISSLPIDMLKIDKTFVDGIINTSSDRAIVSAIIQMAKTLELEVIAEGVETEEQAVFLSTRGCDKLQGYLISKPLSAVDLIEFIKTPKKWRVKNRCTLQSRL